MVDPTTETARRCILHALVPRYEINIPSGIWSASERLALREAPNKYNDRMRYLICVQ